MKKISLVIPLGPGREFEGIESAKKQAEIIIEAGSNPSRNRNNGIKRSRTKLVGFVNGHTILDGNWSDKVLDFFRKHKETDIVGGPQFTPRGQKGFAGISGIALSSKFGTWKTANRYSGKGTILDADETMLTSANLVCKRKVFKKVKFDESIYPGEDPKFISAAKKAGFSVAYYPDMIVYNKRRESPSDFAKQIFEYGRTRTQKESIAQTIKRPFFLVPSAFLVYLVLVLGTIISSPRLTGAITGMSSTASATIYLPFLLYFVLAFSLSAYYSVLNKKLSIFLVLPFAYFVMHISYGAGILYGYLKKIREKE